MSLGERNLFALAPLHLQAGLGIQAIDPLVVHQLSGLAQLQIDHAGTVTSMTLRQGDDLFPEDAIAIRHRLIAV